MSRRQKRNFASTKLILTPVIHAHSDTTGDMVLQVTSLATFGICHSFYARRPFPSWLQKWHADLDQGASSVFSIKGIAEDQHRQHAVVCAVAAREGFEGRWPIDFGKRRDECEQDPYVYWLAPMDYFWPEADA
jgi:hypothetical protein